jgi:hypothetical protein
VEFQNYFEKRTNVSLFFIFFVGSDLYSLNNEM